MFVEIIKMRIFLSWSFQQLCHLFKPHFMCIFLFPKDHRNIDEDIIHPLNLFLNFLWVVMMHHFFHVHNFDVGLFLAENFVLSESLKLLLPIFPFIDLGQDHRNPLIELPLQFFESLKLGRLFFQCLNPMLFSFNVIWNNCAFPLLFFKHLFDLFDLF